MGEGELKCHCSPLQTFSLSPSSSTPPPPPSASALPAQLPQLPAGSEQEGGEAGKQGQGKDTGPRGPEAEAEAENVVWELTKWLEGFILLRLMSLKCPAKKKASERTRPLTPWEGAAGVRGAGLVPEATSEF